MSVECPVCRQPIPWHRVLLTTAWGSWRCGGCDSLLGVNVRRRIMLVAVWLALLAAITRFASVPLSGDLPLVLLVILATGIPYFLFLERARVIERRGFRCQRCGYDLQGQVEPRCPECGIEFDAAATTRTQRVPGDEGFEKTMRRRRWIGLTVVIVLFALTVLGVVGTALFRARNLRYSGVRETHAVLDALGGYAQANDGRLPEHAIQLVADGHLSTDHFVTFHSLTMTDAVPLAGITLAQFHGQTADRKRETVQSAVDALPEVTVVHRLGDFVFTYHGLDLATADPALWVVIWSPDPAQNPPFQWEDRIPIGLTGGDVIQVGAAKLPEALSTQNTLRVAQDLPPLVNPFAATHTRPIVATPTSLQP